MGMASRLVDRASRWTDFSMNIYMRGVKNLVRKNRLRDVGTILAL